LPVSLDWIWKYEIERGIKQAKSFSPNPIDIKLGDTVTWINSHRQGHTITSDTVKFDLGNIGQGQTLIIHTYITMYTALKNYLGRLLQV
jgi:plastocyanin